MDRRMFLGVRKKRPIKRIKKKLLNKLLDYLTSDSYMFAPLISRPPSASTSSSKKKASVRGVEVKKPVREKKKLLKNVSDYLKSNSYMYAPLLAPPQSLISSRKGSSLHLERVTTFEVSKRKVILKGYKPNEKLADGILKDQACEGSLPEEIIKQQSSVQKETVKQKETFMVHNSCRSSSMPGKEMLGSQITKLID
ncbi:hypothetical protein RchiOBHm_Chr4g0404981 [Rosa chinensis]|uniref:Uncharacterized protein n=1 Tax=Rosa chinensis TaxID=74649 RepID=A0A2P6QU34_ROSCH|nr:uncharacterized protein LOC112198473 isoform X1 [Rosa chinensis]PRQ37649.1 hypothetical protein RchiOBHm_Chr4g0404981 [Rosa chinensis]